LIDGLALKDVRRTLLRNIVSIGSSQNLFDDLTDHPAEWTLAQEVEDEVKPLSYRSRLPVIHRPFEDARWFNAIYWPFRHWQASRFSDGSFGVWYGCDSARTSVYETACHWFSALLGDAGFQNEGVIGERKLYRVECDAALLDLRAAASARPELVHKTDYSVTRALGTRLHHEGHPGLLTVSVRHPTGQVYAILNPEVLSRPRSDCQMIYRLESGRVVVEKQPGVTWMEIPTAAF
jgi:hypothetical protein